MQEESIHAEVHGAGDNREANFARWGLTSLRVRMVKKVEEAQINTIVTYCRKGESITNVEKNLKEQGIIEIL